MEVTGKKAGVDKAFRRPRHLEAELYALDVIRKAAAITEVGNRSRWAIRADLFYWLAYRQAAVCGGRLERPLKSSGTHNVSRKHFTDKLAEKTTSWLSSCACGGTARPAFSMLCSSILWEQADGQVRQTQLESVATNTESWLLKQHQSS